MVIVGLGAIGREVAARAARHPEIRIAGAADPAHAGASLEALVPGAPSVPVSRDAASAYRKAKGGVALLCTTSSLEEIASQVEEACAAGLAVVSSCEELAHPAFGDPDVAERIDRAARRAGVSVLGTGVNPGFVLDRLVVTLGAVTGQIRSVQAGRVVDVGTRREALQRKVGVGITALEFERRADAGEIGHVGLSESCALVAEGLALAADEIEEEIDPVLAPADVTHAGRTIPAGHVLGVRHVARAFDEGREVVRLTLQISLGAERPRDFARIDGDPPLSLEIPGGVPGEEATAWALVNAAPRVAAAEPGLLTVLDLPAGR